jgi:hypothetical protein
MILPPFPVFGGYYIPGLKRSQCGGDREAEMSRFYRWSVALEAGFR